MTFFQKILPMILVFFFLAPLQGYGAQSSADASASAELKEQVRREVLGAKADRVASEEEYVIGYGDQLMVSVYGEGNMAALNAATTGASGQQTTSVDVRMDGRISLMHVGDVNVVGMTLTELADFLKKIYSTIYSDPIITTVLTKSNSRRYTVMGKVLQPGVFSIEYPITLVQALARGGGFTEWANHNVTVVREKIRSRHRKLFRKNTLKFDYDDFLGGEELEKNIVIQDGDIVIVH